MKDKIHPKYQPAVITCACGAKLKTRSTKPEISTEVCSDCHPFFTGKQKLLDTAGRVDKFKAKLEAAKKMSASKKKPATKKSAPKTAAKKGKK